MEISLNTIRQKHKMKSKKRIGRGGKRGATSGKGTKGQKSRAGHRIRPAERDLIKKIPKLRGRGKNTFKSIRSKKEPVNLGNLEKVFSSGDIINPKVLIEKGLVMKRGGIIPIVKILATGTLTKKFTVQGCDVSASAKVKIEKASGAVISA